MIEVQGITKVYGSRKVVDNISFTVGDTGITGFLGPNGAGKSTTMNIIAGYTSSSAGTVRINGAEILEDPIKCKKNIGYLPERPPLYPDMTVEAYLSFIFDLKKVGLPKKKHIADVSESLGIADVKRRIIKNLSKGYQQRVGLAQAMLGNPGVLILDEPTVGLDPRQILDIRGLIQDLGKRCAVIFSSHILQEVQAVCERIIVINNGVLVADDTPDNLARSITTDQGLILCVEGSLADVYQFLQAIPGMRHVARRGSEDSEQGVHEFLLESEPGFDIRRDLFRGLAEKGWTMLGLRNSGMSLEDIFLRLTAGDSAAISAFSQAGAKGKVNHTEQRSESE
jgi:ABC-2 type transport system ATP-binding protein